MLIGNRLRLLIALLLVWSAPGATAADRAQTIAHFENRIRPLLVERCIRCHGPEKQRGGLRLDRGDEFLKGAETGPVVVGRDPDRSLLIKAVRYGGDIEMPPDGRLSDREIADLEEWVRGGAFWPDVAPSAVRGAVADDDGGSGFTAAERSFWAFQPPIRQVPPAVVDTAWPLSAIDRFVQAQLEDAGLAPAGPATRAHLIRRVTLDLIGLPPTPAEVREFVADSSPDAFARLVDRLLASPAYGERWGRRWLDVARYADSNGLDENMAYEHAWRYRDYVIRSFNADTPFDRFVCEQLAGDLLAAGGDDAMRAACLTATGFLALGPKSLREVDAKKMEMDIVDEQVATVGQAFLGMTLGCARCHDHKFDPISQEDYYALAGIFSSTRTMKSHGSKAGVGDGEWMECELPTDPPVSVMAVTEGTAHDLPVHVRGSHLSLGAHPISRGFPRILQTAAAGEAVPAEQSGRLQLARWLTAPGHPLTSRVLVNRIWQGHFGAGLVRTANNFGELGERPDHPELLDWLATTFVEDGWSIKALHRRMLLSRTYQMSTAGDRRAFRVDPSNRLLGRMSRRRMEAEVLRDSILAVCGSLDRRMEGTLSPLTNRQYVTDSKSSTHLVTYDSTRRSVYLPVIRNVVYDLFSTFDFPDPSVSSEGRAATVVAPQALVMMNSEFVLEQSRVLASLCLEPCGIDDATRLDRLYERVLGRHASDVETADGLNYLQRFTEIAEREGVAEGPAEARLIAWQSLAQAVLATNEFIYIE